MMPTQEKDMSQAERFPVHMTRPPLWKRVLLVLLGLAFGTSAVTAANRVTLRVLTWNVLAPQGMERFPGNLEHAARIRTLLAAAAAVKPDLVAWQEVTPPFVRLLREDPFWSGYQASTAAEDPPGGVLILSRRPFAAVVEQPLPGRLGRVALLVKVKVDGHVLTLASVHLESLLEDGPVRRTQMEAVSRGLEEARLGVWLGDFNFGDDDPEQRLPLLTRWTDAWARLRSGQPGYTYDLATNPRAREQALTGESSRRLDRVLLTPALQPKAVGLVGDVPPGGPPSDHYGLWVDLRIPAGE